AFAAKRLRNKNRDELEERAEHQEAQPADRYHVHHHERVRSLYGCRRARQAGRTARRRNMSSSSARARHLSWLFLEIVFVTRQWGNARPSLDRRLKQLRLARRPARCAIANCTAIAVPCGLAVHAA